MPIVEIENLPSKGVLIGIDPGSKRIGVAISDMDRIIASPNRVIQRNQGKSGFDKIISLISEYEATGIVV